MLTVESRVVVPGLTGAEVAAFLLDCTDVRYQAWWPAVHRQLHPLAAGGADRVGDVVLMDEYIGRRRVRMAGEVIEVEPGRKIFWQFKKGIRLPARLTLELTDLGGGVAIRHTITAGWTGPGRFLDPLLRLYFPPQFAAAMDQHVRTEFPLLRDLLHPAPGRSSS